MGSFFFPSMFCNSAANEFPKQIPRMDTQKISERNIVLMCIVDIFYLSFPGMLLLGTLFLSFQNFSSIKISLFKKIKETCHHNQCFLFKQLRLP